MDSRRPSHRWKRFCMLSCCISILTVHTTISVCYLLNDNFEFLDAWIPNTFIATSLIAVIILLFLIYSVNGRKPKYTNATVVGCGLLILLLIISGGTVIFIFVKQTDAFAARVSQSNNSDENTIKEIEKRFGCCFLNNATLVTVVPTRKFSKSTEASFAERDESSVTNSCRGCERRLKSYARYVATVLFTGYFFNVLMAITLLVLVLYYKSSIQYHSEALRETYPSFVLE